MLSLRFQRAIAAVAGWLFGSVMLLGAVQAINPVTQLSCALGLASLVTSVVVTRRLPAGAIERWAHILNHAMVLVFVGFFILTMFLGGSAGNGGVREDGTYYLRNHEQRTVVSARRYYMVGAVEVLLIALWPAGMVVIFRHNMRKESARELA